MKKLALLFALVFLLCPLAGCTQALQGENNSSSESAPTPISVRFTDGYLGVGTPLVLTVTGISTSKITYRWYLDGVQIAGITGNRYTPTENDRCRILRAEIYEGDRMLDACELLLNHIPVVSITSSRTIRSRTTYVDTSVKIAYNTGDGVAYAYTGNAGARIRGNSTADFPKKPYKLKLESSTNLFGMGKSRHWVLIANYIDESNMHNSLAFTLSKKMGMRFTMDNLHVDLLLNGVKKGTYELCEQIRIDGDRVDLYDWEGAAEDLAYSAGVALGYNAAKIQALETYLNETMVFMSGKPFLYDGVSIDPRLYIEFPTSSPLEGILFELSEDAFEETTHFYTKRRTAIAVTEPEYLKGNKSFLDTAKTIVQNFEDCATSRSHMAEVDGAYTHYSQLTDFEQMLRYFLISELFKSELGYKSCYFYINEDELLTFGPLWDFDYAAGVTNPWRGPYPATEWYSLTCNWGAVWFPNIVKDPYFAVCINDLFWQYYHEIASIFAEGGEIDELNSKIYESALYNSSIWSPGFQPCFFNKGYNASLFSLRSWLSERFDWMCEQFASYEDTMESFGIPQSQALIWDTQIDDGICTVKIKCTAPADEILIAYNGWSLDTYEPDANGYVTVELDTYMLERDKNVLTATVIQNNAYTHSGYLLLDKAN